MTSSPEPEVGRPSALADVAIETFEVVPDSFVGRLFEKTKVNISWKTEKADRLVVLRDGEEWFRPTSAAGTERREITKSCTLTLRAFADEPEATVENQARVRVIGPVLFWATLLFTGFALVGLWYASSAFLSDAGAVQQDSLWKRYSQLSKIASYVYTLTGIPLVASLLRLMPGRLDFALRVFRRRLLAGGWLLVCALAIAFVGFLRVETDIVVVSSTAKEPVHLMRGRKISLTIPPGVTTVLVNSGENGLVPGARNALEARGPALPPYVVTEKRGDVWIVGCWSEVDVHLPPRLSVTVNVGDEAPPGHRASVR